MHPSSLSLAGLGSLGPFDLLVKTNNAGQADGAVKAVSFIITANVGLDATVLENTEL